MLINFKSKGVSLLELLLVLSIMAVLLVAAFSRYQQYQYEVKISEMDKSITLLQQALAEYFFQYCRVNEPSQPDPLHPIPKDFTNVKELLDAIGWSTRNLLITNPLGNDFVVAIKSNMKASGNAAYSLQISAQMKIADEAVESYKRAVNASGCVNAAGKIDPSCKDKIFVWLKLPWYSTPGVESNLWIMKGGLLAFNKNRVSKGICAGKA